MFLGRETLEDHSQLPKKANKCSVGAVASFSYVWRRIGMSASSLHRESIYRLSDYTSQVVVTFCVYDVFNVVRVESVGYAGTHLLLYSDV